MINAIIHRDYASATTIQIRVCKNRISIWNAAHLTPEWAAEWLAEELSSKPHNPRIAYALFRAGLIEAWGRGIPRIVDLCRAAGNPIPAWRLDTGGNGLWVRFPYSAAYLAADSAAHGNVAKATTQEPSQERRGTTRSSARDRILDCLRAEPELTFSELAERVGLTRDGVKHHLENLNAIGFLRRVGSDRAKHWEVLR